MTWDVETYYQALADFQRERHIRGGYGWPGKPLRSCAKTRYPNILAELDASKLWLETMAEFAGVTPEIMAAVIEDGEELTYKELLNLSVRWECGTIGYLSAPTLQIIDPATNKGKRRRWELADLMEEAAELPDPVENVHGFYTYWKREASDVHDALNAGDAVTFAEWWWACYTVEKALQAERSKLEAKGIRAQRRGAV